MARLIDIYAVSQGRTVSGVATGKPLALGVARSSSKRDFARHASAAVQGFGKVGQGAARFLHAECLQVVAASDQHGAAQREGGLDIPALELHVAATGSVVGFAGADARGA